MAETRLLEAAALRQIPGVRVAGADAAGDQVERAGLLAAAGEVDGGPAVGGAVGAGEEQPPVLERAAGDEERALAERIERLGPGVGLGGGGVPRDGLGAGRVVVGKNGQRAVEGPAPLAALLGLRVGHAAERQRQRDAELGEIAELPAAGADLLEEVQHQRGGVGVERAAAELAAGVGVERLLAETAPGAVEQAAVVVGGGQRGLDQPLFRGVEGAGVEGLEDPVIGTRARRRDEDRGERDQTDQQHPRHSRTPSHEERLARGYWLPNECVAFS